MILLERVIYECNGCEFGFKFIGEKTKILMRMSLHYKVLV